MGPDSCTPGSLPWPKIFRGVLPCPPVIPKHGNPLGTRSHPPWPTVSARAGGSPPGLGGDGKRKKLGGRWFPQMLPGERWGLGSCARRCGTGPKGAKLRQIEFPPPATGGGPQGGEFPRHELPQEESPPSGHGTKQAGEGG